MFDSFAGWNPGRNAVHRLIQLLDVVAIALNRFRQLAFKLPHYSDPNFQSEHGRLQAEYDQVKFAVFPKADIAPQHTATRLRDAAVAELARAGSKDEAAVIEATNWLSGMGWVLVPTIHDLNPEKYEKEGAILACYAGLRNDLRIALSRLGYSLPVDILRRESLAFNSWADDGNAIISQQQMLEWVHETTLADHPAVEPIEEQHDGQGLTDEELPTGKVPGVVSLNVLRCILEMTALPDWQRRLESWPEVPFLRLKCAELFTGQPFSPATIELLIAWFEEQGLTAAKARHLPLSEAKRRITSEHNAVVPAVRHVTSNPVTTPKTANDGNLHTALLAQFDDRDAKQDCGRRGHEIGLRRHLLWEEKLARPVVEAVPAWANEWVRFGETLRNGDSVAAASVLAMLSDQLVMMQLIWETWRAELASWYSDEAVPWHVESQEYDCGKFAPEYPTEFTIQYTSRPTWVIDLPWPLDGPKALPKVITSGGLFRQGVNQLSEEVREYLREVEVIYAGLSSPKGIERLLSRFQCRERVAAISLVIASTIIPDPDLYHQFLDTQPSDSTIQDARQLLNVMPDFIRRRTLFVLDSQKAARRVPSQAAEPTNDSEPVPDSTCQTVPLSKSTRAEQIEVFAPLSPSVKPPVTSKRSTVKGEGRMKLIAALTKHHQYADGGCLHLEPIGNNALARLAGVSESTASAFFNNEFQGHTKYKALCRDSGRLAAALKLLNNEFSPHNLYGGRPADEGDEGNLK